MYKIIYRSDQKGYDIYQRNVNIWDLSTNITRECDIFEITNEEIHLGCVLKKTIACLAIELCASFMEQSVYKKPVSFCPEAGKIISLGRKCIEEYNSVSEQEKILSGPSRDATQFFYANSFAITMCRDEFKRTNIFYGCCVSLNESAEQVEVYTEYMRQGEFIIDFLKSGKHLFL